METCVFCSESFGHEFENKQNIQYVLVNYKNNKQKKLYLCQSCTLIMVQNSKNIGAYTSVDPVHYIIDKTDKKKSKDLMKNRYICQINKFQTLLEEFQELLKD